MVLQQLEAVLRQEEVQLDSAAVRGNIERSGTGWTLALDVQVGSERRIRRLSATSCDDLGSAAAVALALLIRPLRSGAADPPPPSGANESRAPEPPSAPPAPVRDAERALELDVDQAAVSDTAPIAWQLGGEAVLDSSTLAGPALGASVQSELRLADWGFGAYGLVLPPRRRDVAAGGTVEFAHWSLGLRICRALWNRAWRLDACMGAELGRFAGSGSGLSTIRNEVRDLWLGSSVGLHLAWHVLPHAALIGRVEALFPLLREEYVINVDREVHETPTVTGRMGLGLEFDLL